VDSWLGEDTVEDESNGNTTWDTNELGLECVSGWLRNQRRMTYHSAVTAVPVSVGLESRGHSLELTVGSLDLESVL
jgi:hypothetical protein